MRVVVNNIAASNGGALTILKSFYNYIISSNYSKKIEWIFLLNDNYIKETENIKVLLFDEVKRSRLKRLKFDLYSGKKIISELKPDVVLSLQNTIIFGLDCPQVLYVHQSIPFQQTKSFSFFKTEERSLAVLQYIIGYLIKKSINKANTIVVQTKWMKDAVIRETKVLSHNIICAMPPTSLIENINKEKENLFRNNNFFYPAGKTLYKNHNCIFEARSILNGKGIEDFNVSLTINGNDDTNFSYLGEIPFDSVVKKYNTSTLIFPSYIETLGLPLIEARQVGSIILVSDYPFAKEALDGYENAYYFDPFKPNELASLMEKVINGNIIKEPVNSKVNKRRNSWEDVVNALKKQWDKDE